MPEADEKKRAVDEGFGLIYEELRRLAYAISRSMPAATYNPTALVSEAYLKLAGSKDFAQMSPLHFKRLAAQVIRQVLCDAARRRLATKRGGEGAVRTPLSEQLEEKNLSIENVVIVDDLLNKLEELNSRQAKVVQLWFYGGLSYEEIAVELGISRPTVERDWRAARAWLATQLSEG